jgi:glyoxalase family protein
MIHQKGIHHITAIAGQPQQNLDFYAGLMGLRLIKKTVNFDDPSTYHLYYGVDAGNPGSILTFFPYPGASQGEADRGQAIVISFAVPEASLEYWEDYLDDEDIDYIEPFTRFGKQVLGLQDPDGLHLELIADPAADEIKDRQSGSVPAQHAIRGIYGITLAEETTEATGQLLTESLGFKEKDREHDRVFYKSDSDFGSAVEIIHGAKLDGRPGKGTIHHVAFRAKDEDEQLELREELATIGYHLTDVQDRQYFQSVYFHEPGGVLFEIATDGPGFAIDETEDALGRDLKLPPRLEERRNLIEAELPKLT